MRSYLGILSRSGFRILFNRRVRKGGAEGAERAPFANSAPSLRPLRFMGMNLRFQKSDLLILILFGGLILFFSGCAQGNDSAGRLDAERPPNFIVIFTDDQGYGDLSSFGARHVSTPNIDRLAGEGAKLTSFYVAAALCTPSRAALLTGCYPKLVNLATGSDFPVLLAGDPKGLHSDEITIAEVLKKRGYATGIFGKWHLGDQPEFLPTRQGFDEFFGIPYSHDIHPLHPRQDHFKFPPLPLLDGETVIEMDPDADYLTKRITERAIQFIENHREEPFFLYVPHPIPHHPVHVSPGLMETVSDSIQALLALENGSVNYTVRGSLYPQAISEIDWSVGQIVETLIKHKLDSNTLVIFTTDNGPDAGYDTEPLGSAGPLRGRKGSTFEGGMRVPTVAWWPGKIPAGVETDELLTAMDLLPTFANLSGADLPQNRVIDGKDIWPVLSGQPGATSPHDRFYYHRGNELRAVRSGPWKYHQMLPNRPRESDGSSAPTTALYNLEADIGETQDLSAQHPEIVEQLQGYIKAFELELGKGDSLSTQSRPAGWVDNPKPLSKDN